MESIFKTRCDDLTDSLCSVAEGLGALVIFAGGSPLGPGATSVGLLRFLTDLGSVDGFSLLLLAPQTRPLMLISNPFMAALASEKVPFATVEFVPLTAMAPRVKSYMESQQRSVEVAGLVGRSEMPVLLWESLAPLCSWLDVTASIQKRRHVKESCDVDLHKKAARISDALCGELSKQCHQGKTLWEMKIALESLARLQGAEYVQTWLSSGPRADRCRFHRSECQAVPQDGDQLLLGTFILYEGHWGHSLRMGTVGAARPEHRRLFDIVLEMEHAALEQLKPKGSFYSTAQAMEKVISNHLGDGLSDCFRFRDAHGLGFSYEDPLPVDAFIQHYQKQSGPRSVDATQDVILPGMVLEVHPNFFPQHLGCAVLGDMVLITEEGNEILTKFPRELIEW